MITQAKMLQEEKALEDKLFGTPKVAETTAPIAPVVPEVPKVAPIVEAVVAAEIEKPSEVTPVQEREEDWKLRFTNLRASRDQKVYDAQRALASSEASIVLLQQKIQTLMEAKPEVAVDLFKDAFTEEEREALGETAIAAMQKTAKIAADAQTVKINQELKDARAVAVETAKLNATNAADQAYRTFENKLASVVSDYTTIDADPAFKVFMNTPDIDGSPRLDSFAAAESRGDAATVAKHMLDFKATLDPKAAAKASLEAKVTPTGTTATPAPSTSGKEGDILSMGEINAHYKKHAQDGYRGKQSEFLAMEARIDAAALSGKIRG